MTSKTLKAQWKTTHLEGGWEKRVKLLFFDSGCVTVYFCAVVHSAIKISQTTAFVEALFLFLPIFIPFLLIHHAAVERRLSVCIFLCKSLNSRIVSSVCSLFVPFLLHSILYSFPVLIQESNFLAWFFFFFIRFYIFYFLLSFFYFFFLGFSFV